MFLYNLHTNGLNRYAFCTDPFSNLEGILLDILYNKILTYITFKFDFTMLYTRTGNDWLGMLVMSSLSVLWAGCFGQMFGVRASCVIVMHK